MSESAAFETEPKARWFGAYLLLEALPPYGMVQPYVAREEGRVGLCVVKRLLPALEGNPTARARFAREAKIGASLQHPGIVPMVGHGAEEGTAFLAVDFLVGEPLQAALAALGRAGSRMPLPIFQRIAYSVLDALSFAHKARSAEGTPLGIVHRDLTPRNLILTYSGEVKVSDFGVAHLTADDFKTVPGIAVGTLEYLSPEQATGTPIDARSDLYTLSTVLYEMLAGQPVIPAGSTTVATLSLVTTVEPTPLASIRPDLSPRLVAAIERGLAKDRNARFGSAGEMKAALEAALGPAQAGGAEQLSVFLRGLLPESEGRMLALIDRIRDLAAQAPPRPSQIGKDGVVRPGELDRASPSQLSTLIVRQRSTPANGLMIPDEPPEPSVMTMPGTLVRGSETVPLPKVATLRGGSVREPVAVAGPSQSSRVVPAVIAGVALVLVVALLLVRRSGPEPVFLTEPPSVSAESTGPMVTANANPPEPELREPPPPRPATPPVPSRVAEAIVEGRAPVSGKRRGRDPVETVGVSGTAAPPPAPPSAPAPANPYAALRQKIRGMIANQSKVDVRTFDNVYKALVEISKDLPGPTRLKVNSDLEAANLSQDAEMLGKALDRIERSRRTE